MKTSNLKSIRNISTIIFLVAAMLTTMTNKITFLDVVTIIFGVGLVALTIFINYKEGDEAYE